MSEVKQILVSKIDPQSDINVRRLGIADNVEKIKSSIQQHGYWHYQPIAVRRHPNPESRYEFQHIAGQCRLKACSELGIPEIPAVILEMSDDEAIQRSWLENEVRTELFMSDKAYWTESFFNRYAGDGYTGKEALELAARFLGVKYNTVIEYYRLVVLPERVMRMVDARFITQKQAGVIVKNTYKKSHHEESQQKMIDRAVWLQKWDIEGRKLAVEALNKLQHKATINELNEYVMEKLGDTKFEVTAVIPKKGYDDFLKWGEARSLEDKSVIASRMIAETLQNG